jgi:type I site-specific restriction endonuclease
MIDKKTLSERDICTKFITPAVEKSGWNKLTQLLEEVSFTQVKEFDPIKLWWNNRKESEVCWKVNIKTIIERGYDLDIKNPTKPVEEKEYNSAELIEMLNASFEKSHTLLKQLKQAVK